MSSLNDVAWGMEFDCFLGLKFLGWRLFYSVRFAQRFSLFLLN